MSFMELMMLETGMQNLLAMLTDKSKPLLARSRFSFTWSCPNARTSKACRNCWAPCWSTSPLSRRSSRRSRSRRNTKRPWKS